MNILILPFHGFGHFNGLFGVARALSNTHNVIFAGSGFFYGHVTSYGFPYISLSSYPFGVGLENWVHEIRKTKNPKWTIIRDRWKDTMYHQRFAELSKVIAEHKPVHVLVDTQQATDLIVLRAIDPDIRVSLVSIPPPYLLIPGLPPVNSLAMPGGGDEAYRKALKEINAKVWRQRKKYFGMDDRTIVNRRLRRNNMMHLKDVYPSLVTLALRDVDQYILMYKEFDFHHPHLDQFHYVGPHPDTRQRSTKAVKKERKLIYCSFGTVASPRNISGFISKLKEAAKDLDYDLVYASRENWVDQIAMVSRADVFVTHGGMNSIHDAIRFKVPMIVYPIEMNYDQPGNSSRVVYYKLGLRGDLDSETVEGLKRKIVEVEGFRQNFDALNTSSYTIDNFIKKLLS